jgi:hypothetical protein
MGDASMHLRHFVPRSVLALGVLFLLTNGGHAGAPKIEKVRVGLPSGSGDSGRMRQGTWSPVYIELAPAKDGNTASEGLKLVLDTVDLEENPYHYTVGVPTLGAEDNNTVVVGYLRAPSQDVTVTLQTAEGRTLQTFKWQRSPDNDPLPAVRPLYVVVGRTTLPKLREVLGPEVKEGDPEAGMLETREDNKCFSRIERVEDMPDKWFGYDAAEAVILATGSRDFVLDLKKENATAQRKALAEWVRRGGKLVVSVGSNRADVNDLLLKMTLPESEANPLLPFEVNDSVQRDTLQSVTNWSQAKVTLGEGKRKSKVQVATFQRASGRDKERGLGQGTHVLLVEKVSETVQLPILVESSCGLGRVVLVAFDVDAPPFNDWEGQGNFWRKLRDHLSPGLFAAERFRYNFNTRDRPELAEEMQRTIDSFEDVPVISFGWVALFIFFYIILVGPLDYLVLKKVFKRLELTWVTFPAVVITISVSAYFIAYYFKGDDLQVHKIDLIEIDLHTPQAYGTTWFSVFSPRVQNYTLGVDPAGVRGPGDPKGSTVVALLENPTATPRGSASLFRQPYEYARDAAGIENVPIPVWSTHTFLASWRTGFAGNKPPVRAELVRRPEADAVVTGKIVNDLPVDLEDVYLIYHNKWYKMPGDGRLVGKEDQGKGGQFEVADLEMKENSRLSRPMETWFHDPILADTRVPVASPQRRDKQAPAVQQTSHQMMKVLMFYRAVNLSGHGDGFDGRRNWADTNALNSGLRTLNQNWRLDEHRTDYKPEQNNPFRDEVILVGRVPSDSGRGKDVNAKALVQLWNDQLPKPREQCPELAGKITQETYIRVYIPVKAP